MSIADHGGFDVLIEASPTLATELFASGPRIQTPDTPFTTPLASGTARLRLTRQQVAFATGNTIVLKFDLTGSGVDVSAAPGFTNVPPSLSAVDIGGSVTVLDRVDSTGLSVSVDTTPDASAGTPGVTVTLDNASVLASPLISILLAQAYMLGGEDGMTQARNTLLQTIETTLHDGIATELNARPAQQTLFTAPARFLPPAAPLNPPATVAPVAENTARTLLVGMQLGGVRGNLNLVTRSSIRSSIGGGDIDGLALVISNASLLRDFLRPTVGNMLGLTAAGFRPDDPFMWFGSVTTTLPGAPPITVTSVAMFVNEMQQLVLSFGFSATSVSGSVMVTATVMIPITLGVMASAGSISLTLMPGRPTVTSSRVDIAWWVYLLSAVTLGNVGLAALALADAIANGTLGGSIEGAIAARLTAITSTILLPAGLSALNVTMQSLFQSDAPRRTVILPGTAIGIPALGRDHDMIVTFAA